MKLPPFLLLLLLLYAIDVLTRIQTLIWFARAELYSWRESKNCLCLLIECIRTIINVLVFRPRVARTRIEMVHTILMYIYKTAKADMKNGWRVIGFKWKWQTNFVVGVLSINRDRMSWEFSWFEVTISSSTSDSCQQCSESFDVNKRSNTRFASLTSKGDTVQSMFTSVFNLFFVWNFDILKFDVVWKCNPCDLLWKHAKSIWNAREKS